MGFTSLQAERLFNSLIIVHIDKIIKEMNLKNPIIEKNKIEYLIDGVDLKRLYNHPIKLNKDDLYCIYENINN